MTVFRRLFLNVYLQRTPQAIQWRCCSGAITDKVPEATSIAYVSTSSDYKKGKKAAIARLQEIFKLHHTEAIELAMRFKKVFKVMNIMLSDNYHLMKSHLISDDVILKYLDLLAEKELSVKIDLLKQLPFQVKDLVPLLTLHTKELRSLIIRDLNGEKRIATLSELLKISVFEASDALVTRKFLLKICLTKVEKNLQILLDNGASLDEIHNDYWVFQYNYDVIQERIELAKKRNIGKIKTWMVRAPIEVLDRYCQRRSDNKQILGDGTLAEYLSQRLECNLEIAKIILLKHPALLNKHMRKIKEVIDFLLNYGFTPLHIIKHPKILLHSVETTAKRLKQLESEGVKLDSLYVLTKSQKEYLNYYENLVKANKSKMKESG